MFIVFVLFSAALVLCVRPYPINKACNIEMMAYFLGPADRRMSSILHCPAMVLSSASRSLGFAIS
jgi:hypothetical protein